MKRQTLFSGEWVQTAPLTVVDQECPKLRGSQLRVVRALKDQKHVILDAPTGWGKSIVIITLLLYKLRRNPKLRGIIAVPQTLIGRGFIKDWKLKIGRKLVEWVVGHNLCDEQASTTVDHLIDFLKGNRPEIRDRVLICTHATLALCYRRLKKRELSLFRNVVLWIDEAHHVMNAEVNGSENTVRNSLGTLVEYCMKHGSHIGLATATYMRGDRRHILSDAMIAKFEREHVAEDEYFKEVQPVESFKFNILCGNKLKAIRSIFKESRPTIIYLAKRQSRYADKCKYKEVEEIIKVLAKGRKVTQEGPVTHVGRHYVIDLVTEEGRSARKNYLNNGGKVDVIIALETCKEGFDWPAAERSIIFGERHSIPEMIQMIGRILRPSEGKTTAEVHQILPAILPDKEAFKEQRNSMLTCIFAAMLLEDFYLPIPLRGNKTELVRQFPDTKVWQAMMRDFLVAAERGYEASLPLRAATLNKHGIPEAEHQKTWNKLWQRVAQFTHKGLDVPFEVLKKIDLTDGLLTLASGLCGTMTFTELRRVMGRECKTPKEHVLVAEQLAKENGGKLQNPKWLVNNGHGGLNHAMWKYPDLFRHIEQESKKGGSPEEWVVVAEQLAKENGGKLQNPKWLIGNGHGGLYQALRKHPDLFKHIDQEIKIKPPKEHALVAEQLAKENGGKLQNTAWLIGNGYGSLYQAIQKHPDLFRHIDQERERKTPEEHVLVAEQLAKENGGKLQNQKWLTDNGHNALSHIMWKYPDLFRHIDQKRERKTPKEHVLVAEQLAKENGGKLQNQKWLTDNGHNALCEAKRDHPDLFRHIDQENKGGRPPKEWVVVAEQLAKENGGKLQNPWWLQKNGHQGIHCAIRDHPDLFKHIDQESKKGRSPEEWAVVAEQLAKENGGKLPNYRWLIDNGYSGLRPAMRKHPDLFKGIL